MNVAWYNFPHCNFYSERHKEYFLQMSKNSYIYIQSPFHCSCDPFCLHHSCQTLWWCPQNAPQTKPCPSLHPPALLWSPSPPQPEPDQKNRNAIIQSVYIWVVYNEVHNLRPLVKKHLFFIFFYFQMMFSELNSVKENRIITFYNYVSLYLHFSSFVLLVVLMVCHVTWTHTSMEGIKLKDLLYKGVNGLLCQVELSDCHQCRDESHITINLN